MSPMIPTAALGITALWLTYLWLGSAIVASSLSRRQGYGERPGLAAGLLLSALGVVVWLVVPAKKESAWKREGAIPKRRSRHPKAR